MTSITELLNKKKQGYSDKRMGSKNAYKFKTGKTTIRILPTWRKDASLEPIFSHPFGQSFIKDMDGKTLAVIGAKNIAFGESDPIQDLIQNAKATARTDAQRKHWDDARAKNRELVNALILDDKEVDPNVAEIVDFSGTQFETILDQIMLADIAEEFLSLESGFNLIVSKTGSGVQNTKYTFAFERKPTAVNPSVMESVVDLDAYVRSKMVDTDRAINAIKSITAGGEHLSIEDKSISYSGDINIVDGEYNIVDDARDNDSLPWENGNINRETSDEEIDNLFSED